MVDTQPLQASVTSHLDMSRRQAAIIDLIGHGLMDLGGQDDLVSTAGILRQPFANKGFGRANAQMAAILVGRIDEVDPRLEGVTENGKGLGL